jgi:vacuolar-type H+-ATPase subunit E/Vma4
MTTEEKLQHFLDSCVTDARTRSDKMLEDYEAALQKTFEDHKADAKRRQAMQIQTESEKIKRDGNKQLSLEHTELRKAIGKTQEDLKDRLFVELKDKLANFMETSAYHELLEKQIREETEFAGDDPITIYLDPADEQQLQRLAFHSGADIKISDHSFIGGTKAVIPGKNVLIDNSFETRIAEERENFNFIDRTAGTDKSSPAGAAGGMKQ